MRKDAFVAAGGYRKAFVDAGDYDLWLRFADRRQLANLGDVVLRYRIHPNQVSSKKLKRRTYRTLTGSSSHLVKETWRTRKGG